ncbi:MAG: phosphatase PAP2 family protein [Candidatus Altiarchaeota archaeon]|nr:phosphatase PAP2 family protein [Candidatus Altiarchaeota archaeon]
MDLAYNVYRIIDSIPEFPYFLLAIVFVFTEPSEKSMHVLSMLFIYVFLALAVGIIVKYLLKTQRPKERYKLFVIGYDVPSLHTIIAVGLVFFTYFIDPVYSLLLVPLAVVYMHSRVSLGFHTKKAVAVGAFLGVVVGFSTGQLLAHMILPGDIQLFFVMLVLIIPLLATYLRIINYRRLQDS